MYYILVYPYVFSTPYFLNFTFRFLSAVLSSQLSTAFGISKLKHFLREEEKKNVGFNTNKLQKIKGNSCHG